MPVSGEQIKKDASDRQAVFGEIIDRFSGLLRCQAAVRDELDLPEVPAAFNEDDFLSGVPLVHTVPPGLFISSFRQSAARVWPVLGDIFPGLREAMSRLEQEFSTEDRIEPALRALIQADDGALDQVAVQSGMRPELLLLCLRAAWAPVIAAVRPALLQSVPVKLWRRPYCPVCGSEPDLAALENHPDPSEFLVSKSGEIWHHCPACLHRWRFMRVACPGCGNQDHERLTRFSIPAFPQEHIYACEVCHCYLPCLDLVESSSKVDFDFAALKLIHLDAVAQSRGYIPLSPAPWTPLGEKPENA